MLTLSSRTRSLYHQTSSRPSLRRLGPTRLSLRIRRAGSLITDLHQLALTDPESDLSVLLDDSHLWVSSNTWRVSDFEVSLSLVHDVLFGLEGDIKDQVLSNPFLGLVGTASMRLDGAL